MATHDGSIASQVEDWICARIEAITLNDVAVFEDAEVEPWEGQHTGNPRAITRELFQGRRDLVVRVFYDSDRVVALEEGEIKVIAQFVIWVGIQNRRAKEARRGDGTTIGTNRIRDLLRIALHDQQPATESVVINDGTHAAGLLQFGGSQLLMNTENMCVQQTLLEMEEVELAA